MIMYCSNCKKKNFQPNHNADNKEVIRCKFCYYTDLIDLKTKHLENRLTELKKYLGYSEINTDLRKTDNEKKINKLDFNLDEDISLSDIEQIQQEIINNQKLLIDEYKNYNNKTNLELEELTKKIKQYDEIKNKIKFYQDDNLRLSNEMSDIKKKYEIIKENLNITEKEKNNIFKQIQDLNNSLLKNNIIGSPFLKDKTGEININSKILNDISEKNLKDEKPQNINNDLNTLVKDIFK